MRLFEPCTRVSPMPAAADTRQAAAKVAAFVVAAVQAKFGSRWNQGPRTPPWPVSGAVADDDDPVAILGAVAPIAKRHLERDLDAGGPRIREEDMPKLLGHET